MISFKQCGQAMTLLATLFMASNSWSETAAVSLPAGMTERTGIITGTSPQFYNQAGIANRVDFSKDSADPSQPLRVGDTVTLSWQLRDSEGDEDISHYTLSWACFMSATTHHTLQHGGLSYNIKSADQGCIIQAQIQPTTATGNPQNGDVLFIDNIGAYDEADNIPDRPVEADTFMFTDYIVAPGSTASQVVAVNTLMHTAWAGAKIQIESNRAGTPLLWQSSNNAVATVSAEGIVTFKTKGEVVITANDGPQQAAITFNPAQFYIFSTTKMTWSAANSWCEVEGYRQPTINELSVATNTRQIPSDSLWQEWGNVAEQIDGLPSPVFWSATNSSANAFDYMYIVDGHISSDHGSVHEGAACVK